MIGDLWATSVDAATANNTVWLCLVVTIPVPKRIGSLAAIMLEMLASGQGRE